MTDLKEVSNEIAKAIFDRIEHDETLILANVADVIHKELAVRVTQWKEPDLVKVEKARSTYDQIKEIIRNMDAAPRELGNVLTSSNPWWPADNWIRDAYFKPLDDKKFKDLYVYGWDLASDASQDSEVTE